MTACGTPKIGIEDRIAYRDHYVVVAPDPSLRACLPQPAKPDLTGPDAQKALAEALVALAERGDDCASKLGSTWESIDQANAKAAASNAQK